MVLERNTAAIRDLIKWVQYGNSFFTWVKEKMPGDSRKKLIMVLKNFIDVIEDEQDPEVILRTVQRAFSAEPEFDIAIVQMIKYLVGYLMNEKPELMLFGISLT
mmetsp:Transcript_7225/g.5491  ORF Transcript_7225/g.5491 Transcript_7225/m.5491 type:complete len:104 (-) Transcript_7225:1991-2302(-)|eukprot:CAMPEP_0202958526 /NCGR_PEP_ID=MMETSP1396-20130829/2852_1 /ASSEMBLY_ACC=CAM_ASM_000872 /TAXON_ID= /ORGANISM="Pseudokeronopsis sp., Strain Brazil" /LENGTH=103 /DNA_ID=CAMNT_0049676651 /DNA_START=1195 /DNA_END=1506 /DNA_ORIENTATION=-